MSNILETTSFLLILLLPTCFPIRASTGNGSPPQILLAPEDTFPVEGNLEFSCKGTGFPEPHISWFDANTLKPIDETAANIHINQYLGRLTIADPEEKRIYSVYCNISNTVSWVVSPVVHGALAYLEHDFPRFPIDRTAEEGDIVLLECQPPRGNPAPTIEWLLNNAQIPPDWGSISPEGDLHIREAKLQHTGTYACRAKNAAGERISPAAILHVKRKAVRFLQKPRDNKATVGSSVTFHCQASDSKPVSWRRDNGEHLFDAQRVQLSPNSMTIRNVQLSDSGKYICVSADGSSTAEARLLVSAVLKPVFPQFPTDQNATEGDSVVFLCRTSGSHKFSSYWDLPNQMSVFPNDHIGNISVSEQGDLHIRSVRLGDSGIYQCTVDFDVGPVTRKAVLRVFPRLTPKDALPLPPVINLPPANQTRLAGDTVILDCEVGITREPETGFDVMERDFESKQSNIFWVRGTRSTGGLQERIEFIHRDRDPRFSLLPGGGLKIEAVMVEDTGNYTCFFQANNGPYMQSNWTSSLLVLPPDSQPSLVTEPTDPLSPPENLRVQNQTANSVTLMWNPPNIHDTNQVSYWIEMFHTAEADFGWQVLQESWPRNAIRLEPLQPNSAYYFLIRPRWIDGRVGWASAPLGPIQMQYGHDQQSAGVSNVIRLERMLLQVISSTSARVIWSLENPVDAIPAVTGFSVRYKEVPLTKCISAYLHDSTFCSLRSGDSIKTRLNIYQQKLNTASLRDTQGVSLVPHQEPEMFADVPIDQAHDFGSSWSTTITHLKPFRCYSLLVQPNTVYPRRSNNESSLFLTQEDAPSAPPQIIGVKKMSNHSVEISWTVPPTDSWNGLLTGFVVYVFNAAQDDKRELKFSYGDTTGVVSGLKTGEIYHLQMTAVNCRGSSSKSIPINFSVSEGGIISDSSPSTDANNGYIQLQPWIIGIVVGVLVIWLLVMFFGVIFCLRQRTQTKQRYPPSAAEGFSEDLARKCSGMNSKEAYNLLPISKPHSISGGASEMECTHGSDLALKAPTTSTQQNTTTTIASTNSSSTGGSCNPTMNHRQHPYEEGIPNQHSDFSPSQFFSHVPTQHIEYPFVDYRPAEISNSSVFSASLIENSPKTSTGLPLVAPVAQLGCQNGNISMDNMSSSVTPYATASLINTEVQKANAMSPGSRTPSDMSSNTGGSGHLPMMNMHSPQRYSARPQQYLSRSSSGTTTGAEDDYLSHQQNQQHVSRRKTIPRNIPPNPQIPPTFAEYELCMPTSTPPLPPPPLPMHQNQMTAQIPANGGMHTPVF
ncbi:unnamed protein product [Hymenolepis diminuta]|uniref:Down syndrome cell adhesion molecule-like protein Dscam2 n=2 Tax=Hymenolepis diminuta TaxID=6216 RepID=A0A0R3SPT7_HYMDI|nr:unnamed protein product [Hymenolepis diminuta]